MKKLQVILGFSVMVAIGGIGVFDNHQVKASSRAGLIAEAAPPSDPRSQTTKPGVTGGGSGGGSGASETGIKGPPKLQPRVPKA